MNKWLICNLLSSPCDKSSSSSARTTGPPPIDTTALLARVYNLEAENAELKTELKTKLLKLRHRSACNEFLVHALGIEVVKLYADNTAMRMKMGQVWERLQVHDRQLLAHEDLIQNLAEHEGPIDAQESESEERSEVTAMQAVVEDGVEAEGGVDLERREPIVGQGNVGKDEQVSEEE